MNALHLRVAALALLALAASCTSIADLEPYPLDAGSAERVEVPYARAVPVLRDALTAIGVTVVKDVEPVAGTRIVYGTTGPFLERQGEVLRVVVRESGEHTEFHALAEKRMKTNPIGKSAATYSSEIRDAWERALGADALATKYGLDKDKR